MPITLYGSIVSPPTRATMMLIDILGIEVEFKEVNLPMRDHYKPDYLERNPLHTIPMLEDDDYRIVDSHAIMTYLCSKYDNDNLYPKDIKVRCTVDQRLYFDATVLFPRLRRVIYDITQRRTSGLTEYHINDIIEAYDVTEKYLEASKYIATDELTVADLSCIATTSSLNSIIPINEKYVKIHAWMSMLKKEEWYQKNNTSGNSTFTFFLTNLLRR
ncbi:unnamed protein product [Diatraea saccharalis]|uniref:Uncharacterized protein n=1 Tax=Diatraea saccharalis TaxID=40085 RepID=A0A9N9REB3_9NEOP|nr:unnamed protein product [Diatraea saccharalis]